MKKGAKKKNFDFDPERRVARKQVMLAQAHSIPRDTTPWVANPAMSGTLGRAAGAGANRVTPPSGDKAEDWIACLIAVRDTQDESAFAALFAEFAPRVKGFLMRSGADAALAEEIAQEAMATVWRKAHLFDPSRASVSTWIFTIARNRRIDVIRRQRRPEPEDLPWGPEPEPDQAEVIGMQQECRKLGDALAALPEKQRELVEKAYFGDLTHSEIAAETGLPLGTIKSRIRLALDRLRHSMSDLKQ